MNKAIEKIIAFLIFIILCGYAIYVIHAFKSCDGEIVAGFYKLVCVEGKQHANP